MASKYSMNDRPSWPRRAIVTAGEPYGNKGLHFGHVGGVFVPADFFARFLRVRLGRENGIFTSGTDCYGSPIMESYRKLKENEGYDKSIGEYVESNHSRQAATLNNYNISCDIYGGSGLEPAAQIHNEVTAEIIERLHEQGTISKRSTLQFYDAKAGTFLNGRQVIGRCPIQGCKSEKAYADECDLGRQFEPEELIAPKSQLTGEVPELRPVDNHYFDLPADLDMGGSSNWTPLGGLYPMDRDNTERVIVAYFNGTLDGQGHRITNLFCDRYAERAMPIRRALASSVTWATSMTARPRRKRPRPCALTPSAAASTPAAWSTAT